jgi:hypothetical protein
MSLNPFLILLLVNIGCFEWIMSNIRGTRTNIFIYNAMDICSVVGPMY